MTQANECKRAADGAALARCEQKLERMRRANRKKGCGYGNIAGQVR